MTARPPALPAPRNGAELRRLREALGLTQTAMAAVLGLEGPRHVRRLEAAEASPLGGPLRRLAAYVARYGTMPP